MKEVESQLRVAITNWMMEEIKEMLESKLVTTEELGIGAVILAGTLSTGLVLAAEVIITRIVATIFTAVVTIVFTVL